MLDFSDMPSIVEMYERVTRMEVNPRSPYAGQLVFAAFSGSHQDAIAKGLAWREEHDREHWTCPYLPIDPADVGRRYETDVIRINSQSGKGGIGYILEKNYGYVLPPKMREELSYASKDVSDHAHKELAPEEVNEVFHNTFVNHDGRLKLLDFHFTHAADNKAFKAFLTVNIDGVEQDAAGNGNGRLDAVCDALAKLGVKAHIATYSEHALDRGSDSRAAAYVGIDGPDGGIVWGAGEHHDIITASILGLISAVNRVQA